MVVVRRHRSAAAGAPRVVANVPLGLAFFAHATSKTGDWLTRSFETVFALPQAAKQARVFNFYAAVLYDLQARVFGAPGSVFIDHAELQPQAAGANGNGILGQRWDVFAFAKAVHHVDAPALAGDGLPRVGQAGEADLAQDAAAALRHHRVHRHDAVAMRLHVLGGKVAGAVPFGREADHGDGAAAAQNVAQGADGVGGAAHAWQCTQA